MNTITGNNTLQYQVVIESANGSGYIARLLTWPDILAQAPTREKALQQLRTRLLERLAQVEIVTLEIQPTEIGHSWAPFAGMWADDLSFDEFQAEIQRYRRETDEKWVAWLFEPEEEAKPNAQAAPTKEPGVA